MAFFKAPEPASSLLAPLKTALNALAGGPGEGAMQTLMVMALLYAGLMLFGAALVRVPAAGWQP